MFMLKSEKGQEVFKAFNGINSVTDIVTQQLPTYGSRSAIRFDTGSTYASLSFTEYHQYIQRMISYFQQQDIERKVIATFCKNRIEWDMVALAAACLCCSTSRDPAGANLVNRIMIAVMSEREVCDLIICFQG